MPREQEEVETQQFWNKVEHVGPSIWRIGISFEESLKMYNDWSDEGTYDEIMLNQAEYGCLNVLTESMRELYPTDRESLKIIDIGAGTGLLAEKLYRHGFEHLDALDASEGMLKKAAEKGLYENLICEMMSDQPLDIPADSYDAATVCSAMCPSHLPFTAFVEMIRIIKPGGYIVNCMREEWFLEVPEYKDQIEPFMKKLEDEGKWKAIKREIYPNHYLGKNGVLFVFQVC